ncbi:hypothetical protein ERJ75_001029800 [Trypanosoma vivax]|nr:hypothetical protein ERJ75_001029800 [Trypanosoma vivax]
MPIGTERFRLVPRGRMVSDGRCPQVTGAQFRIDDINRRQTQNPYQGGTQLPGIHLARMTGHNCMFVDRNSSQGLCCGDPDALAPIKMRCRVTTHHRSSIEYPRRSYARYREAWPHYKSAGVGESQGGYRAYHGLNCVDDTNRLALRHGDACNCQEYNFRQHNAKVPQELDVEQQQQQQQRERQHSRVASRCSVSPYSYDSEMMGSSYSEVGSSYGSQSTLPSLRSPFQVSIASSPVQVSNERPFRTLPTIVEPKTTTQDWWTLGLTHTRRVISPYSSP